MQQFFVKPFFFVSKAYFQTPLLGPVGNFIKDIYCIKYCQLLDTAFHK